MSHCGKLRNMTSVYLMDGRKVLLLYRQGDSIVHDLWIGSAGGHFEAEEYADAKACVLRELYEELSLTSDSICDLQLRYITLRNTDTELRQNYYFFAKLKPSVSRQLPSTEGITQWFPLDGISELPMPFTARYMIDHYFSIGQYDEALYGGIANENGMTFTKL